MEYVIRLDDKRLYDALVGFLRSLGANVKGTVVHGNPEKIGTAHPEKHHDGSRDGRTRERALSELLEFASTHPLKLPKGYRFNREELYDE